MTNSKIRPAALTATMLLLMIALGCWFLSSPALKAQALGQPGAQAPDLNALQKERLTTVRDIAKLAAEAYKAGLGSYDEVREAAQMVLQAELEQCASDKERVAVLQKFVAQAKQLEDHAAQLSKTGQAPTRTALKAKAERLQAEISLQRAAANAAGQAAAPKGPVGTMPLPAGPTAGGLRDQVALAEHQVAIKRAAVKVAEAQKAAALATLVALKAQVAEGQAAEALAAKQVERFESLVKTNSVEQGLVDERRAQWEAAKARRAEAEGKVGACEAQVRLEQARVELARAEVEGAELRLKQLNARLDRDR
jgi:hypothetical protein